MAKTYHYRYWLRNLRTDEERVVSAYSLREALARLGWDRKVAQVCKQYRCKGKPSELILLP